MTEEYTSRTPMEELRHAFDALGLHQKAEFVLEAAFSTFASGVEAAGRTLSRELDDLFAGRPPQPAEPDRRPSDEAAPGAAEAASPPLEDL